MAQRVVGTLIILAAPLLAAAAETPEPLHQAIDRLIEAQAAGKVPLAGPASDAEFLRRIYLDLVGMVPTEEEARQFFKDSSPDKRAALVDRLLADARFPRRMADFFNVMLMERRDGKAIQDEAWIEYLRDSFANDKPYDQLVREIVTADGMDPKLRPAARFYLDRGGEPNLLVRDVSRLFLGMDLQCAQCHNHPLIGDYQQEQYYGLFAYLGNSYVFTDAKKKQSFFAEKVATEASFKSVFTNEGGTTGARVLSGPETKPPKFAKDQEYFVKPDKNQMGVPKYTIRWRLGDDLTSPNVPQFSRNIANRLWALLMGRGLVHPLDLHHSDNPPSHPELLDLLAARFVAGNYDIRSFVRELALSQTYQRSSELPAGVTPDQVPAESFAVSLFKPLTPEQIAWSMLQISGQVQAVWKQAADSQATDPRLMQILEADERRQRQRSELIETTVYQKLRGNLSAFVSVFGAAPGQVRLEFESTAAEALFMANGGAVQNFVNNTSSQVVSAAGGMTNLEPVVEQVYLRVLTRLPSDEERSQLVELLKQTPDDQRAATLRDVIWAMLASAEFRLNH